jgi:hypothetical protein
MVELLRSYSREETFPANHPLFTHGERQVDMFAVFDGEVIISPPAADAVARQSLDNPRYRDRYAVSTKSVGVLKCSD